jgi:hypothetical protein
VAALGPSGPEEITVDYLEIMLFGEDNATARRGRARRGAGRDDALATTMAAHGSPVGEGVGLGMGRPMTAAEIAAGGRSRRAADVAYRGSENVGVSRRGAEGTAEAKLALAPTSTTGTAGGMSTGAKVMLGLGAAFAAWTLWPRR